MNFRSYIDAIRLGHVEGMGSNKTKITSIIKFLRTIMNSFILLQATFLKMKKSKHQYVQMFLPQYKPGTN
jgi:hypothetical protein